MGKKNFMQVSKKKKTCMYIYLYTNQQFFFIYSKHGCDYKGYGLASRLPRLDLSAFTKEKLEDRQRPIVQQFCVICQAPEKTLNKLVPCQGGCSRAYHQYCHSIKPSQLPWYCSSLCQENKQKNKVVVDLPRKYLPLMRLQQQKKSLLL